MLLHRVTKLAASRPSRLLRRLKTTLATDTNLQEKVVTLCRHRGFVFPGSDIYGGLANSFDYGPLGVQMKKNIQDAWWKHFVQSRTDCVGLDSSVILNSKVWEASGHIGNFTDPMTVCKSCNSRSRADKLIENKSDMTGIPDAGGLTCEEIDALLAQHKISCPTCAYINFQHVVTTMRRRLPFGVGQMGKSFRNEISPGHFLFRTREFEQLELQYFCHPTDSDTWYTLLPHVVEPALGTGRVMLAMLLDAYDEEEVNGRYGCGHRKGGDLMMDGRQRTVLRLHPDIAPYKFAVLPLQSKGVLAEKANEIYVQLAKLASCDFDVTQSIGKRYRRQDEIGTPFCVTVDFDTLEDGSVTVRNRDSMDQVRVPVATLLSGGWTWQP
ncbi:hypothetical protein DYB37_008676 [Aphanomyces astaci]|uniref:Aminoacyl-transfer RNA synthetases class-II family profile domain-containing protein n=2 Tax=Aphanomyces astaci TaxID=112090 RepID=A0A3L6VDX9_APHAT|nr:hypothetical protein DYB35_008321 [Aphanomyces astaci]RHZ19210.1 hypothetical protein DYB37_008676 [Aphanomyces astaci]RLO06959.1 hypothetical protein DYB28_007886 [Aphanomyces astaci]